MFGDHIMQTTRHILSITLILTILATGLPIFSPEDANRDSTVDIRDAILSVKGFTRTADNPAAFRANFGKTVSALQVLAGLKTVIKQADDAKSAAASLCLDLPYLISSIDFSFSSHNSLQLSERTFLYESFMSLLNLPPPQNCSVC